MIGVDIKCFININHVLGALFKVLHQVLNSYFLPLLLSLNSE